jgi:hypothetical protein
MLTYFPMDTSTWVEQLGSLLHKPKSPSEIQIFRSSGLAPNFCYRAMTCSRLRFNANACRLLGE